MNGAPSQVNLKGITRSRIVIKNVGEIVKR